MVGAPDREDEEEAALQTAPEVPPPLHPAREPARPAQQKASARSCVLTLINCAVGAPLLSLPYAYQQTGWAAGIMLTVLIAAMEAFTLFALACHAEKTGSATYSALVRSMLGPAASILLSLVTITFAFGSCCAYLMILADCVQPMLEAAMAGSSSGSSSKALWWARRENIIVVLGSGVMLPLSFPDSLDALSGASSIALCGLVAIVGSVAYKTLPLIASPDYQWGSVSPLRFSSGFLAAFPILVYGFQSHTNVVAVFHELEDEPVLLPRLPSLGKPLASIASFASMASLKQLTTASEEVGTLDGEVCSRGSVLPERWCTELVARHASKGGGGSGGGGGGGCVEVTAAAAAAPAAAGQALVAGSHVSSGAGNRVDASEASDSSDEQEELLPDPEEARAWQQQQQQQEEREGEQGQGQAAREEEREQARTAAVSAKLRGMIRIVYTAIGLTAAMYCLLGLFGYLCFSSREIGPNILDMYAFDDPTIQVARVMLALIQLVSYPINLLPARAAIWHLLEAAAARRVRIRGFHSLSTLAFFGATLAVALSTTDLGMMFQLIGGTCGAVLIFGMPGGLLMGYAWQEHGPPRFEEQQQSEAELLAPAADPELGAWPEKQPSDEEQELKAGQEEEQGEESAAAQPARVLVPGFLHSKLWWSGLALVLLTAGLCAYSLHSVLAA